MADDNAAIVAGAAATAANAAPVPAAVPAAGVPDPAVAAVPAVVDPPVLDASGNAVVLGSTDWRNTITDPEHLEFAKRHASVADLAKSGVDLRKANGSMTRVPGKDSSPEDIAKFNKLIGIPATAAEYKFDLGREATDADKAIQAKIGEIFLANRVSAEAAPAISKAVTEMANAMKAEQNRVAVQARENTTATLRKELGADYDSHLVLADRAVKQWGNPGFAEFLNKPVDGVKIGDHPDFVRVFGAIGRRMGEGGFIGAVGGSERQTLQAELTTLMNANPPGSDSYKAPEVQRRVVAINEALHGTGAGVGMGGRSA